MVHLAFEGKSDAGDVPIAEITTGPSKGIEIWACRTDAPRKIALDESLPTLEYAREAGLRGKKRDELADRLSRVLRMEAAPTSDEELRFLRDVPARRELAKEIRLRHGECLPLLKRGGRTVVYCWGMSGSGKSTLLSKLAEQHIEQAGTPVFLLSRLDSDDTWDRLNHEYRIKKKKGVIDELRPLNRIVIDEEFVADPLKADDFPDGSLVVFDDYDSMPKAEKAAVYECLNDTLQVGRHRDLSVFVSSHLGAKHGETKLILNEAHLLISFPAGTSKRSFVYTFSEYSAMDAADCRWALKLGSRFVCVRREVPIAVIHEHGAYLLDASE
jgi:hypothetical protein